MAKVIKSITLGKKIKSRLQIRQNTKFHVLDYLPCPDRLPIKIYFWT